MIKHIKGATFFGVFFTLFWIICLLRVLVLLVPVYIENHSIKNVLNEVYQMNYHSVEQAQKMIIKELLINSIDQQVMKQMKFTLNPENQRVEIHFLNQPRIHIFSNLYFLIDFRTQYGTSGFLEGVDDSTQ